MYHFELRKFPHTVSRFNQSERQVLALVMPWTREEWVEVGERKWNVNETKLTVLEGPELSLQEMAMNRGWRNALRRSDDVTERVLTAVREHQAARRGGGRRRSRAVRRAQAAQPRQRQHRAGHRPRRRTRGVVGRRSARQARRNRTRSTPACSSTRSRLSSSRCSPTAR